MFVFEGGNGRIHRFLIHNVPGKLGFSPDSPIFPVSAAIARDRGRYDEILESFSQPLLETIAWRWISERHIEATPPTVHLHRFFDATLFAELSDTEIAAMKIAVRAAMRGE